MKRRIPRVLLWLVAPLLAWPVVVGAMIWNYGCKDHATKSDCIIVLGAAAYGDRPSPVFEKLGFLFREVYFFNHYLVTGD